MQSANVCFKQLLLLTWRSCREQGVCVCVSRESRGGWVGSDAMFCPMAELTVMTWGYLTSCQLPASPGLAWISLIKTGASVNYSVPTNLPPPLLKLWWLFMSLIGWRVGFYSKSMRLSPGMFSDRAWPGWDVRQRWRAISWNMKSCFRKHHSLPRCKMLLTVRVQREPFLVHFFCFWGILPFDLLHGRGRGI